MTKITKLTPAQEKRLVEFREEWLQIGLCCEPADFKAGDEVIRGFYARLNKPAPIILHFSSPAMCELAVNVIFALLKKKWDQLGDQLGDQLRDQLGGQLWGQLRDQLWGQLWGQLRDQLWGQLWGQLWDQLGDQLGDQLRDQLRDQLWGQLRDQLWDQLGDQLRDQLGDQLWGQLGKLRPLFLENSFGAQHFCAWEAFYLFGHEIGVRYEPENIALLLEWARQSKSIGWWAPWDGICFVSDRPRKVKFDNERRLHCETGKAVEYSDGWGVSAWQGTLIPDEWIADKKSLTAKIALTQKNIEQRRAAIEIVGWNRILLELKAKVIDEHPDPACGSLVEVKLPDLERPARFIRAMCGTKREFAIGVPAEIQTVIAAQAWLTGLPESQFEFPSIRT